MSIQSAVTGIPDIVWKIGGALAITGAAIGGVLWWRQALIDDGVSLESFRRDGLAKTALIESNKRVAAKQAEIDKLQLTLSTLQSENQNAQAASLVTESALRSGAERLRVEVIGTRIREAGQLAGSATPAVDYGPATIQDLSPEVAGNLESLRRNENNAIDRLNACVIAYDKVREQSNSLK